MSSEDFKKILDKDIKELEKMQEVCCICNKKATNYLSGINSPSNGSKCYNVCDEHFLPLQSVLFQEARSFENVLINLKEK